MSDPAAELAQLARDLKLTKAQRTFALGLAQGLSQTAAAREAGASDCAVQGSRWAKMDKVRQYRDACVTLARARGDLGIEAQTEQVLETVAVQESKALAEAESDIMAAHEVQAAMSAIARGRTEEQQRLEMMGRVADLSKYVRVMEIPNPDGGENAPRFKIVTALDIDALQRDGLGHLIKEIREDAVKFHDPVQPTTARLKSRKEALDTLARIHGLDKGVHGGEAGGGVREVRTVVLAVLSGDAEARKALDELSRRVIPTQAIPE